MMIWATPSYRSILPLEWQLLFCLVSWRIVLSQLFWVLTHHDNGRWEVCLQFPSVNEAGNWPINLKCNSSAHLIQETVKQRRWPCDNDVGYVTVWTCTQKRRARCDKAYSRLFFIMGCSRLSVLVSRMHRTGFPSELSLY